MNWFTALALYLIIWWLVLFVILPIGIRGQAEEGDIVEGSEPGAPHTLDIKKKFKQTTIAATIVWAVVIGILLSGLLSHMGFGI